MLRQQTFLLFLNQNFQFMIYTLASDHFIVYSSNVILTFNIPEQMFQMNNCAKEAEEPRGGLHFSSNDRWEVRTTHWTE